MKSKNCFLVFRNKKLNDFGLAESTVEEFLREGYYFDKIDFIAYDSGTDVARSLITCQSNYDNLIILCPQAMENTIGSFLKDRFGVQLDYKGVYSGESGAVFILLSDAPDRLKASEIVAILNEKCGENYEKSCIKAVGIPNINASVAKAKAICPEIDFNISDNYGDFKIELTYNTAIPKAAYDGAYRALLGDVSDRVYAVEDISLAQRLVQLLKLRRMRICVAESFTGGGICKRLVEVPGVSEVFFEGLNTYSNLSKMRRLGVNELTLKSYGAVSEQTACEMAAGLVADGNCDVAVATTGIAGPASDNSRKPVGLVYIAVALKEGVSVNEYNLKGDRKCVTETAINLALFNTFKLLK